MKTAHWLDQFLRVGLVCLFSYSLLLPYQYIPPSHTPSVQTFIIGLKAFPAILGVLLFVGFCFREKIYQNSRSDGLPACKAIRGLVCILMLGAFAAPDAMLALSRLIYYTITGICLYFVVGKLITKRRHLDYFIHIVSWVTVIIASLAIIEFIISRNVLFPGFFDATNVVYRQFSAEVYKTRVSSTIGHPVYLASYLVLVFPFLLFNFEQTRHILFRLGYGGVLALAFCALFLTFSRGGWIAAFVALVLYLSVKKRTLQMGLICLIFAIGGLLTVPRVLAVVLQRNTYQSYAREIKIGGRIHSYSVIAGILSDFPLLGAGTANYRVVATRYGDYDQTPDNAYLVALADSGLLGFSFFVLIFYQILTYLFRYSSFCKIGDRKFTEGDHRLIDAFLASLVGFLIDIITCDALYFPTTRVVFWMIVGSAVGTVRVLRDRSFGLNS